MLLIVFTRSLGKGGICFVVLGGKNINKVKCRFAFQIPETSSTNHQP